jgi:uncharacterized membrane protein YfhO
VEDAGLNKIRVTFEPGPAGELLWTDTHYPGWKAKADGRALPLKKAGPCFSKIEIPSDIRSLDLCFQPRYLRAAAWLTLVGILGMGILSYPRLSQSAR